MDGRHPPAQEGDQFTDDLLHLLGAGSPLYSQSLGKGSNFQPFTGQPQLAGALPMPGWSSSKGAAGFTGPPIETGATLPYRGAGASSSLKQHCPANNNVSRSVTSGARQMQSLSAQPEAAPNPGVPSPKAAPVSPQKSSSVSPATSQLPQPKAAAQQLAHAGTQCPSDHPGASQHGQQHSLASPSNALLPPPLSAGQTSPGRINAARPSQLHAVPSPFQQFVLTGASQAASIALSQGLVPLPPPTLDSFQSMSGGTQTNLSADDDDEGLPNDALDLPKEQLASRLTGMQPLTDANGQFGMLPTFGSGYPADMPPSHSMLAVPSHPNQAGPSAPRGYLHHARVKHEDTEMIAGSSGAVQASSGVQRDRCALSGPRDSVTGRAGSLPAKKGKSSQDGGSAPHGKDLTEAERRKIRRRVTNRESAKRIRDKRDEQMAHMSEQVAQLEAHKVALVNHMHSMEACCGQLTVQLKDLKQKWCATCVENVKLYRKIFELRKALNPDTSHSQLASRLALEDELASEVTTANMPGDTSKP